MQKRLERCATCKYWRGWPGYGESKGNCLRKAPISQEGGGFPFMEGNLWCGDFEPGENYQSAHEIEIVKLEGEIAHLTSSLESYREHMTGWLLICWMRDKVLTPNPSEEER